ETVQAVKRIGHTVNNLDALSIPTIAAINGVAFGGGLELALAADIRLCADHVKLGLTETSLAIIPGAGGTQRLARLTGIVQAKKLLIAPAVIPAEDVLHLDDGENVTANEALLPEAIKMAKHTAQNAPIAIKQAKPAIDHGNETN